MNYKIKNILILVLLILISCSEKNIPVTVNNSGFRTLEYESRMQWFKEAKFGIIIHYGPGILTGKELSWCRHGERRGEGNPDSNYFGPGTVEVDVYDNLYKQFNPTEFDADRWAKLALRIGAKYLIFTTKHWDGFVNFDSKYTDYEITSPLSPFKRDITREIVDKCRENGLRVGLYYAFVDWHSQDYRTINHHRYLDYMKNQVNELLSNYGKIDLMWFDGGAPSEYKNGNEMMVMVRNLQPQIIINDRMDWIGDYQTPEYSLGDYNLDRYFESCWGFGIGWSWRPNDEFKPLKWYISKLVYITGRGGNCLFGVSPNPQGWFDEPQLEKLYQIGDWLNKYGYTIYKSKAGPYAPADWGASTAKDSTVYLHVLNWYNQESLTLPALVGNIVYCRNSNSENINYEVKNSQVTFYVPKEKQDSINTIIEIKLDRAVVRVPVYTYK